MTDNELLVTVDGGDQAAGRPRRRAAVAIVSALIGLSLLLASAWLLSARDGSRQAVVTDELSAVSTTALSLPDPLKPVEWSTLEDGYWVDVRTKVTTWDDEVLLAEAQQLLLHARAVGYESAKLIRNPPPWGPECVDVAADGARMCADAGPNVGYVVLLRGPIPVPPSVTPGSDRYDWSSAVWLDELTKATARGLTIDPGFNYYLFSKVASE